MSMALANFFNTVTPIKRVKYLRVLSAIWNAGGLTRTVLQNSLRLSKTNIVNEVDYLIDNAILVNGASDHGSVGRSPARLELQEDLFYSIGCFFSETETRLGLFDANNRLAAERKLALSGNCDSRCREAFAAARELLREKGIPLENVLGCGIVTLGIIDRHTGTIITSSALNCHSENYPVTAVGRELLGCPCAVFNNCQILPIAEKKWGRARDMQSFAYLSNGLGLGMILNGRHYTGHQGYAGEFGYMQVSDTGDFDSDGRRGTISCLNGSFSALCNRLRAVLREGGKTLIREQDLSPGRRITPEAVVEAILAGDNLCRQFMSERFESIARGVVNIAYLLNPEAVFFSPWTALVPDCTLDVVKRHMSHYGARNWGLACQILPAECGEEALARTAAVLSISACFDQEVPQQALAFWNDCASRKSEIFAPCGAGKP